MTAMGPRAARQPQQTDRRAESFARTEREIRGEMAANLGRIARTLEWQIERLQCMGVEIERAEGGDRARRVATYMGVRREARLYRWYLEVQREALGLVDHRELERVYPIPGPIRA